MAFSGAKQLYLCNRTPEKLAALQRELSDQTAIRLFQWDQLEQFFATANLIINASALGLDGAELEWGSAWTKPNHRILDVVYGPAETPLVRWARRSGAEAVDGLGMLLHQGKLAFEIWFGPPVPVEEMRQALWDAVGRRQMGRG
jgi:shikimate dehydrogenase